MGYNFHKKASLEWIPEKPLQVQLFSLPFHTIIVSVPWFKTAKDVFLQLWSASIQPEEWLFADGMSSQSKDENVRQDANERRHTAQGKLLAALQEPT